MYDGERFNGISHAIGALLAVVGGVILIVAAARTGDPWKIVSCSVYATMLLTLYLTSTLYHSVRGKAKPVLQRLDHCAIYLLIAGTYTPFMLVSLRGPWGWSLFGVVWGLAVIGIVQEWLFAKGARIVSLVIYIAMGWLVVIGIKPLLAALDTRAIAWLVAGGLSYTGGIGFYIADGRLRHAHGIWHLFVLVGSMCHFIAILLYVV
ncbi:PAQR family membrane homeostasis protein TrhA [Janthinobacterium aquaticum]|uniref:PAQR family membrane homeostasis protein TrhA n=1 Tax=Janthinobacterium sp. FT58W TaxID=2654254 RepID=UPI0012657339|nr:hemolysin III family protein [Janthinobacterium sp. FT58W]KAB8044667.1 hemolysin III family protein [Janthinobacterium sp. FT58W]